MRLIIQEYLQQLKEKDELDFLLCDLLLQAGFAVESKPKTGCRQHGVDIQASTDTELSLFVVKKGNINRKNWNSKENDIRPSIEEIFDVYLRNLNPIHENKEIQIIVATNGYLEESVRLDFNGFISQHVEISGKPLKIELWNIDEITQRIYDTLFNEHLFPDETQSQLRKALYYIEEADYRNAYFERIVDYYILNLGKLENKRDEKKMLSGLLLATQMIAQYAAAVRRYHISIMVTEYAMMRYWNFMRVSGRLENKEFVEKLHFLFKHYEDWYSMYYSSVKGFCDSGAFPKYSNSIEYRLKLHEVVGFLASYAYYLKALRKKDVPVFVNTIIQLLNNNPAFNYLPYDRNISTVIILLRLLKECGLNHEIEGLLNSVVSVLESWYILYKKYPTPYDSIQDATNIDLSLPHEAYLTSGAWGYLLLWISEYGNEELYVRVKNFLKEKLSGVTPCIWILRSQEEAMLYQYGAMYKAGEGIAVEPNEDYLTFKKKMSVVVQQYEQESFSYDEYCFPALEIIASRYFTSVPRIKMLEPTENRK